MTRPKRIDELTETEAYEHQVALRRHREDGDDVPKLPTTIDDGEAAELTAAGVDPGTGRQLQEVEAERQRDEARVAANEAEADKSVEQIITEQQARRAPHSGGLGPKRLSGKEPR
jgi:hypothetical protein